MPVSVRSGTAADAAALGRLLNAFNSEFGDFTPGAETIAANATPLIESGDLVFLIAGDEEGFAQMRFRTVITLGEPTAYLEELYVIPDRRGEGIGRALLEAAMDAARERGAVHMDLNTSVDDVAAIGLYESAGFTNNEGTPDGPSMVYYEREL